MKWEKYEHFGRPSGRCGDWSIHYSEEDHCFLLYNDNLHYPKLVEGKTEFEAFEHFLEGINDEAEPFDKARKEILEHLTSMKKCKESRYKQNERIGQGWQTDKQGEKMNTDRFKFRNYYKADKRYVPYRMLIDNEWYICSEDGRRYEHQEDFTIEQCTGFRDKNGKLIYEWDVIDFIFTKHELNRRSFVVWSKKLCSFRLVDLEGYKIVKDSHHEWDFETIITFNERGFNPWDIYRHIEVVGNIHDPQFGFEYPKGDSK